MPAKEIKKTVMKPTPEVEEAEKKAELKEKVGTNLNPDLDKEHPVENLFEELNALVKDAAEGSLPPSIVVQALSLGLSDFEAPIQIPEDIFSIMSSFKSSPSDEMSADIQQAISDMKKLIADRESRCVSRVMQEQTNIIMKANEDNAAVMKKLEAAEEKLKKMKKKEGRSGRRGSPKSKLERLLQNLHSDEDTSSESSADSDSAPNEVAIGEFTVISKPTSKAMERLAKASTSISSKLVEHCVQYIEALEQGKAHEAKISMKLIYEESREELSIGADAAGNKTLCEALRQGHLGGGSQGKYTITMGSSKQSELSQTVYQVIANKEKGDKYGDFTNLPIETEEMNKYIEEAEARLLDSKVSLPPSIKRRGKACVELSSQLSLSLTERFIAQKRIYKHLAHAIKKGKHKRFENQDAYVTILSRLEEMIKLDQEAPLSAYEVPHETTICARTAQKYLHLGSYFMGEIQKLNKDQAAYNYTVNAFALSSREAQMRPDECMSAFINRVNEMCDQSNSQIAPIDLEKFGWPTRGEGPGASHSLYSDSYKAYFCIANLNHVVVKRDSSARNYITEEIQERAANADLTMDEVNKLVARMNKLGVGSLKHRKKSEIDQSQAFSSISSKHDKPNKKDKSKSKNTKSEGESKSMKKVKLYQKMVATLGGSSFPSMDEQISALNKHVQAIGDGIKFIKKSSSSISVADAFGSIEHVKMPNERMDNEKWALFLVIRDIYGCTSSRQLSGIGKAYMEKYDSKFLDKIEAWRLKHGIKAPLSKGQQAHGSISKHVKERKSKSSKSSKTSKSGSEKLKAVVSSDSDSDSDFGDCSDQDSIIFSSDTSHSSKSSRRSGRKNNIASEESSSEDSSSSSSDSN